MSDRVAMMDGGSILQLGAPSELYARPASVRVAQFIGTPAINLFPGRTGPSGAVELFGAELPIRIARAPGHALTIGIRPQSITAAPAGTSRPGCQVLHGRLRRSENLGAEHILHVDLAPPASGSLVCATAGDPAILAADSRGVALLFAPASCHVFDEQGARIDDAQRIQLAGAGEPLLRTS